MSVINSQVFYKRLIPKVRFKKLASRLSST